MLTDLNLNCDFLYSIEEKSKYLKMKYPAADIVAKQPSKNTNSSNPKKHKLLYSLTN